MMRRRLTRARKEAGDTGIPYWPRRARRVRPWGRRARRIGAVLALVTVQAFVPFRTGAPPVAAGFIGDVGPELQVSVDTRANEVGGRVVLASDAAGRFVVA